ncbi:hypothetical protein ISN45_Aa04g033220 [Arabidopsis thaliana x Arabidopsis arenosa]|uniref:DUF7705 domain-containing protein n=2 Tax=Arabidopsis thaliana x Arabidopsis arenosa TaxID=1240361 RepID=A0A8T2AFD3_9BRAS|nr:hypothetical protein ISN45_Aa04g033220 [Arabidopsis thaliana x Arabidopsis arenosa]
MKQLAPILTVINLLLLVHGDDGSAVGDPGMRRDGLRVAFEAWNFCNEVGFEAPHMGSPRAADCFDVSSKYIKAYIKSQSNNTTSGSSLVHKVSDSDNELGIGKPKPGIISESALHNPDLYAVEKELYLGSLCQVSDKPNPWSFWMVMLKNGNYDTKSGLCPKNGKKIPPFNQPGLFPCFGSGCMNQPTLNHGKTELLRDGQTMKGWFNGTYDLDAELGNGLDGISYYEVVWEKRVGVGGWVFKHKLKTSAKYPWLMLYLRADATKGFSGGYHYDTRGMLKTLPESPNFKVRLTLNIKQGGGPKSQFYLLDIGSCWKNNGEPCDGDVTTDVTRYSEMIINPETALWCNPKSLHNCPPYHTFRNGTKVHRTDTLSFPYEAYHVYCAPGNGEHLELPVGTCDAFSNPQAQEILQLLPHPVWGEYGYPTRLGDGWVGDPRTWDLDVGGLSSRLYFYQDPGTIPARRIWTSVDVGTEIYKEDDAIAEWDLSDFDVLIT